MIVKGQGGHVLCQHIRCIIIKNWGPIRPYWWRTMASGGIDAPVYWHFFTLK